MSVTLKLVPPASGRPGVVFYKDGIEIGRAPMDEFIQMMPVQIAAAIIHPQPMREFMPGESLPEPVPAEWYAPCDDERSGPGTPHNSNHCHAERC